MKKLISLIAILISLVSAKAADTNAAPVSNSLWDGLSITNIEAVVYGTHFDNNAKWGGGGLLLYKFNGYVSAGLGTDWAGQWRMFNGTLTLHKSWNLTPKLSVTTYGLAAAGTSIGGAATDNGTLASGEGGGAHFNYQINNKWNAGIGGGYVLRQNCGDYSGGSEMVTFSVKYAF